MKNILSNFIIRLIFTLIIVLVFAFSTQRVLASATNGTIDSTNHYAWSENIGWIDFGCANCNVSITDTAVTGYAYNENAGWIYLSPSTSGIINTAGTLSGYAWSENTGWINFAPSGGGVSIDDNGNWSGYAYGELIGWIVFNCSTTNSCATVDYKISTDWRPASTRGSSTSITALAGSALSAPSMPTAGWHATIKSVSNNNSALSINAGANVKYIAISNNTDFSKASLIPYNPGEPVDLLKNKNTRYVKLYNRWGYSTEPIEVNVDSDIFKPNTENQKNNSNNSKSGLNCSKTSSSSKNNLMKEKGKSTVYLIKDNKKHPIVSGKAFESYGFNWNNIVETNNLNKYATGSMIYKKGSVKGIKIKSEIKNISNNTLKNNNVTYKFTRDLRIGDKGNDVKELQKLLNNNHFIISKSGPGSIGNETDFFGRLTFQAVLKFQERYRKDILDSIGFKNATGIFGPSTRKFVNNNL